MPIAPSEAVPDKHDADGVRTERARERSKEKIDGVVLAPIGRPPAQMEMAVDELHLRVRRHDVHAIGGDAHALGGLQDGKRRMARKKRGQRTGVVGREMLDEDDREVGIAWQSFEKLRERLESSSRCADADDAEVGRRPWRLGQRPHGGGGFLSSGARPLNHARGEYVTSLYVDLGSMRRAWLASILPSMPIAKTVDRRENPLCCLPAKGVVLRDARSLGLSVRTDRPWRPIQEQS